MPVEEFAEKERTTEVQATGQMAQISSTLRGYELPNETTTPRVSDETRRQLSQEAQNILVHEGRSDVALRMYCEDRGIKPEEIQEISAMLKHEGISPSSPEYYEHGREIVDRSLHRQISGEQTIKTAPESQIKQKPTIEQKPLIKDGGLKEESKAEQHPSIGGLKPPIEQAPEQQTRQHHPDEKERTVAAHEEMEKLTQRIADGQLPVDVQQHIIAQAADMSKSEEETRARVHELTYQALIEQGKAGVALRLYCQDEGIDFKQWREIEGMLKQDGLHPSDREYFERGMAMARKATAEQLKPETKPDMTEQKESGIAQKPAT
jgi:hypothetical protein